MKNRFTLTLLAALASLVAWGTAEEKPGAPEQAFIAFRDAYAAKDIAALMNLVSGTDEEKEGLKGELSKASDDKLASMKASTFVASHVEGDAAICLISTVKPGGTEKRTRPLFFVLKDGKWLVVKSATKLPEDKRAALQKWEETQQPPSPK